MSHAAKRIGLFGGSFNPAHAGHVHVSREALKQLGLDEVWWIVSPHNPLKDIDDLADFDARFASAKTLTQGISRVRVVDLERQFGTQYTVDTVRAIKAQFPTKRFVWLMGADNLAQLPRWKGWMELFRTIPIAVYPRAPYTARAMGGRAAQKFGAAKVKANALKTLAFKTPPAWALLQGPSVRLSATQMRAKRHPLKPAP